MNLRLKVLGLLIALIILVPSQLPYIALGTQDAVDSLVAAKVDPALLNVEYYEKPLLVKLGIEDLLIKNVSLDLPVKRIVEVREGQVKAIIIASPDADLKEIEKLTRGIVFGYRLPSYWYIEAWVTRDDVFRLAEKPYVYRIMPYVSPLSSIIRERGLIGDTGNGGKEPMLYAATEVIGASRVWREFNVTGEGVTVAVVDTGVDYGVGDLGLDAIARDESGLPMIFDSDELGLVLTLSKAVKGDDGYVTVETPVKYYDAIMSFLSGLYPTIGEAYYGWVIYISPEGKLFYKLFPLTRFYVGDLHSRDNVFKFGLSVQTLLPAYGLYGILYYTVPILYADTNDDGIYDTVYADASTIFYLVISVLREANMTDVTPDPSWYDLSFADEKPAYYGSEIIGRDFNGDGINDFNVGVLAGYLYDCFGVLTGYAEFLGWDYAWEIRGYLLPGMDPNGYYVTIAYDWLGHGTSCAGVIASRGRVTYNLGYGAFTLPGIAPGAKIASVGPGLLLNCILAQFYFSGYDPVGTGWNWTYTGRHKADVISNSWGSSYIGLMGFISGIDPMSLFESYLVASTNTVIVHAAGNGGPGYGTMTIPGSSPFVITVGASTLFAYRPLYGYLPGGWGEVVSWSDRGPTDIGTVKPDVVNIGSFAWAPAPWHFGLGDGARAFDLFGGTSEATPMTAGTVALIIQAYVEKYGGKPPAGYVKTVLKSSARDLGYDPFVQGSGHVDAYRAVKTIIEGGVPRVYSYSLFTGVEAMTGFDEALLNITLTPVEDTQIYTGPLAPGDTATYDLVIEGSGVYSLKAVRYSVSTVPLVPYLDLSKAVAYTPEGPVPLTKLIVAVTNDTLVLNVTYPALSHIVIPVSKELYKDVEEIVFRASIPYSVYDPYGRYGSYCYDGTRMPWFMYGIDIHYWIDLDGDGFIALPETARLNYDIRYANNLHVPFGKPLEKIRELKESLEEYLGGLPEGAAESLILDIRVFFNAYYYEQGYAIVPIKLEAVKAYRIPWSWVSVPETVKVDGSARIGVTVSVPEEAAPGVYQGYIIVSGGAKDVLVPVSVVVKAVIDKDTPWLALKGAPEGRLYENYLVEGEFDWSWRYESGDWRVFPVEIRDDSIVGFITSVYWEGYNTNIDIIVAGFYTPLMLAGMPPKPYYGAVVAAKLSLFLYRSGWGTHYDRPAPRMAVVFAPTLGPGLYWIVVRNTLIDASVKYPEPFEVDLIPIRASPKMLAIQLSGGVGTAQFKIYGSYALSRARLYAVTISGDAVLSVPPVLGVGNEFTVTVNATASVESIATIMIMLGGYDQYSLGLTMFGLRYAMRFPAIIVIPVYVYP